MNGLNHIRLLVFLFLLAGTGCDSRQSSPIETQPESLYLASSSYVLTSDPGGAISVIQARERADDGAEVVVIGRIGGSEVPWVRGRAAFSIVDPSIRSCDDIGSHECLKPWDFC